jgi:hypothetical protein
MSNSHTNIPTTPYNTIHAIHQHGYHGYVHYTTTVTNGYHTNTTTRERREMYIFALTARWHYELLSLNARGQNEVYSKTLNLKSEGGKLRLRVFENRVLKSIFGPKKDEGTEEVGENCIIRSFITCTLRQV